MNKSVQFVIPFLALFAVGLFAFLGSSACTVMLSSQSFSAAIKPLLCVTLTSAFIAGIGIRAVSKFWFTRCAKPGLGARLALSMCIVESDVCAHFRDTDPTHLHALTGGENLGDLDSLAMNTIET